MADEFLLPYKGLYIRFMNGMYYTFDDPAKRQPNDALVGNVSTLGQAKRQVSLYLKGQYFNDRPTKCYMNRLSK